MRERRSAAAVMVAVVALLLLLPGCGGGGSSDGNVVPSTVTTSRKDSGTTTSPDGSGPAATSPGSTAATPDDAEIDAVVAVALADVRNSNPSLPELKVLEAKIVGDYARVVVEPVDASTDAGTAYLKKSNGTWVVFDFGTGISRDLYPDAPAELFQ